MKSILIASTAGLSILSLIRAQEGTISSTGGNQDPFANYKCDPSQCKLPLCKCATRDPPIANPPQFLLLSFDDAIQASTFPQATALFKNRKNPNGCPAKATWFTQVYYSDPFLATQWYAQGNEIADHSVTHTPPASNSYEEMEGFRAWATTLAGIPRGKIAGARFPLLNYSVESLTMLTDMGFTYDSSLAASPNEKFWPYTLDNGAATDCGGILSVCGKGLKAKGLWEVPMYTIEGADGIHLMDPYNDPSLDKPNSPATVLNDYKATFDRHIKNGNAPFGVYLHPVWFGPAIPPSIPDGTAKGKAISEFLDYAMSQPNVWMITPSQLVAYMKNPVSAAEVGNQPYMQCNPQPAPPTTICNGLGETGLDICNLSNGTIRTCYGCPDAYPSLTNPAPNRATTKCAVPDTCDTLWWDPASCQCLCNSPSCAWKDTSRPIQLDKNAFIANGTNYKPGDKSKNAGSQLQVSTLLSALIAPLIAFFF